MKKSKISEKKYYFFSLIFGLLCYEESRISEENTFHEFPAEFKILMPLLREGHLLKADARTCLISRRRFELTVLSN